MGENTRLESIKELNKLDRKLIDLRKKRKELPATLRQLDEAVREKETALLEAEGQLTALRSRYDAKDLELRSCEAEVEKYQSQLGAVKTNKEYSAILSEITTKKADIAKTEDEMLMLMDSIEQQETKIQQYREDKRLAEKDRDNHKAEIAARQREVNDQLEDLGKKRRSMAATIPPDLLHQYERILEKRGETALVPVIDNSCQGCFMKMTPEVQAQLLRNEDVIYCKFCSRIIYLE